MKRLLLITLSLALPIASMASLKIYTWKDETGRTIYGDNPPENNNIKEINPPELTIIPGYKDPSTAQPIKEIAKPNKTTEYTLFKITSPTSEQSIQANTGNLTLTMKLEPKLADHDSIFIYLDGKKVVKNGKSLNATLNNLDRGTHSIFAVIRTKNGDVLINSNTVKFHLIRSSRIGNRNIPR
ncbi:MAG TPA: DUF4124 domain-containing protein [Thiotrichaceae bacterium]|nr:DUF4124 domain-containing protein [Thiotrichaceae bacterium]